jgi:hypothetical protein
MPFLPLRKLPEQRLKDVGCFLEYCTLDKVKKNSDSENCSTSVGKHQG